jgi:hypothetical protein
MTLVSCSTMMDTREIESEVCASWHPVSWSSKDTTQTIKEAKANNAARKAWGCDEARS